MALAGQTAEASQQRGWYRHVASGQNIRHCQLPLPMTKRMAHHFMQAPDDLTVLQALRWSQVRGLGGDDRLGRALVSTRLAESFDQAEFWETVIHWFIAHPQLDRVHVGPIIDYLQYQRFTPQDVFVARGVREISPPAQANLTMKGRSPQSLLRQVREWHHRLSADSTHQIQQWATSGVKSFEFVEGSRQNNTVRSWTIRELLSSKALVAEGRKMKHCVAMYAATCARGDSSIWTMELESSASKEKLLTIEVRSGATICQIRGKANRLATEQERNIVQRWATSAGLTVASYI